MLELGMTTLYFVGIATISTIGAMIGIWVIEVKEAIQTQKPKED